MDIRYNQDGLVPVVVQDIATGQVVMLAYMNEKAVHQTLETRLAHYYSRSRNELWLKGETSGNFQEVVGFSYDCDGDAILLKVNQKGVACHTGNFSCFFHDVVESPTYENTLACLYQVILDRKMHPAEKSYTNYLFTKGTDKILKKIGEESSEVIIGAKNNRDELIYESCDLIYHLLVLFANEDITLGDIYGELTKRMPDHKA